MAGVLVHEWIARAGGSENVLEALSRLFPNADILCLWNDSVGRFDDRSVHESWLARTPLRRNKALALPFMPATWRGLDNRDYDWALISSHLFAHHARFKSERANFRRYVYVHTPARYIWSPDLDRRGNNRAIRLASAAFKPLDRKRAAEGASFAANSQFVRDRMIDAWGVDSRVINPPVEVDTIQSVERWSEKLNDDEITTLESLPETFILGASRFIPYKRLDLVIRTAELASVPVVLAGAGPELDNLRALAEGASVPVHFVIAPSGPMLYALYQRTMLYVFPAVEDFGIMPVEAMAAGAPVLAQSIGGTSESVVAGVTGALTDFESDSDIRSAIDIATSTYRADRLTRARDFSVGRFNTEVSAWVGQS